MIPFCGVFSQDDPMHGKDQNRREKLENLRIWKMTEFLDLTSDQSAKFFPRLHDFEKTVRKKQRERDRLMREMFEKSEKPEFSPTDEEVRKMAGKLTEIETDIAKLKEQFILSVSDILTPAQQIRYMYFETQFRECLMQTLNAKDRPMKPGNERRP
jgi:Spy/CpxP family protein refolding chaperone